MCCLGLSFKYLQRAPSFQKCNFLLIPYTICSLSRSYSNNVYCEYDFVKSKLVKIVLRCKKFSDGVGKSVHGEMQFLCDQYC